MVNHRELFYPSTHSRNKGFAFQLPSMELRNFELDEFLTDRDGLNNRAPGPTITWLPDRLGFPQSQEGIRRGTLVMGQLS
jgi:hypothetical protein